jgi:hypothetical protein
MPPPGARLRIKKCTAGGTLNTREEKWDYCYEPAAALPPTFERMLFSWVSLRTRTVTRIFSWVTRDNEINNSVSSKPILSQDTRIVNGARIDFLAAKRQKEARTPHSPCLLASSGFGYQVYSQFLLVISSEARNLQKLRRCLVAALLELTVELSPAISE